MKDEYALELVENRVKEYEYFLDHADEIMKAEIKNNRYPENTPSLLSRFLAIVETIDEEGFIILMERKRKSLGGNFKVVKIDKENNTVEFIEPSLDYRYEVEIGEDKNSVLLPQKREKKPEGEYSDILWRIYEPELALGFALLILRNGFSYRKTTPEEVSGLSETVIEIRDEILGISYGITVPAARELFDNCGRGMESAFSILLRPEEIKNPETARKLEKLGEIKESQKRALSFLCGYLESIVEILDME